MTDAAYFPFTPTLQCAQPSRPAKVSNRRLGSASQTQQSNGKAGSIDQQRDSEPPARAPATWALKILGGGSDQLIMVHVALDPLSHVKLAALAREESHPPRPALLVQLHALADGAPISDALRICKALEQVLPLFNTAGCHRVQLPSRASEVVVRLRAPACHSSPSSCAECKAGGT
eukprot:CAMPEP_0119375072 /NCGR_PEP_ID=MMETSP1334-20130426/33542_1 /TAXON_ID=127549 /ORGANISM="Calcidiscus leptoporus, Strain RCC1130" /LENGTH=174 /DNA_ID=CAMNT_0007393283 /DNA_START=158 /DNA_END=679 /DNA_ORIENTATION=+